MTRYTPAARNFSSFLCQQNWLCPCRLSYLHLLKKKKRKIEEELSLETLQPRWHRAVGTSRIYLNNSSKEKSNYYYHYHHHHHYYYCSYFRAMTWDKVSAVTSAFWSPLGRSSPPPSSVHYGNVWRQKSSAGSLCGGWEQCDSCTARGHMAATATQSEENIKITAASKLGSK